MGSPGKMPPALKNFHSANVQVADELQACLLLGWENYPQMCGLGAGDIHGQENPLDSSAEDSCTPSRLRSKEPPIHREAKVTIPSTADQ